MSPEVLNLSRAGLIVWLCINIRCNKRDVEVDRQWKVSWSLLIKDSQLSRASVGRALQELERADLIRRKRRGLGRVNQITLCKPPSLVPKTLRTPLTSQNCDPRSHEDETSESSSSDPSNNISRKTSSPTGVHDKPEGPNPEHEQHIKDVFKSHGFLKFLDDFIFLIHSEIRESREYKTDPDLMSDLKKLYVHQRRDFVQRIQHLTKGIYATSGYEKDSINSLEFYGRFFDKERYINNFKT